MKLITDTSERTGGRSSAKCCANSLTNIKHCVSLTNDAPNDGPAAAPVGDAPAAARATRLDAQR